MLCLGCTSKPMPKISLKQSLDGSNSFGPFYFQYIPLLHLLLPKIHCRLWVLYRCLPFLIFAIKVLDDQGSMVLYYSKWYLVLTVKDFNKWVEQISLSNRPEKRDDLTGHASKKDSKCCYLGDLLWYLISHATSTATLVLFDIIVHTFE